MNKNSLLYQPLRVGRFTLKNRMMVAPYGSSLHERDGSAGQKFMLHLRNVVQGGAAMVTIGSGNINAQGAPVPLPKPSNPLLVGNYVNCSELAHQFGCLISQQVFGSREMLAPSEVVANEYTRDDLARWRDEYANAAYNMMCAGFDFIMIHGGHGNGPAMLFSERFNHRTDEYGGSFRNRARFALEVLDAIRDRCGDKLGIEYRMSAEEMVPGGTTLEESLEFAKAIQDRIDILHVSRGLLEEDAHLPYVFTPTYFPHGINVDFAARFKEAVDVPVAVVGGLNVPLAEEVLDAGKVDLVAAARSFIADPAQMAKALEGRQEDIRPCLRCNVCIGQTHARLWDLRCCVNPLAGREYLYPDCAPGGIQPAPRAKKVVLVGGGPANLEAARTAAARGHKVVLFEAADKLGGTLNAATTTDFKQDLKRYLEWSIRTVVEDPRVDVRLGVAATPELVRTEEPDAVVVAVGLEPISPAFTASGTPMVVPVADVDGNLDALGQRVVVAGGGLTGMECALELAQDGRSVTVVDQNPENMLCTGGTQMNIVGLLQLVREAGVRILCDTSVVDVTAEGMLVKPAGTGGGAGEGAGGGAAAEDAPHLLECDNVVVSFGLRRDLSRADAFRGLAPETYVIGDCSPVGGTVWQATRSGFDVAMAL